MKNKIISLAALYVLSCHAKEPLVDISELDPSIAIDMKYYQKDNFVGEVIHGYQANKCFLSKPAASALTKANEKLKSMKLSLKVFDCYRPQRAVNHFVKWAKDLKDIKMKAEFYPEVPKNQLFKQGYIASKSGHSRGSTVDLTIDGLDMGTRFDFFGIASHTDSKIITEQARNNRLKLKNVMESVGFKNYSKEWWHYTFKNEPFPNSYFEFPVK